MRYAKTLLLTVVAVAAMALAATASATTLTSPSGTTYTGELAAEAISGGLVIHNGQGSYSCGQSKARGKVEAHGASTTAAGKLSEWTLTGCNTEVKVLNLGTLEIHSNGNGNGTVTVTGTEVTSYNPGLAMDCIYTTSGTSLGTLTGSSNTGGHAVLDLSATVPRLGGSPFCGNSASLTGSYTVTTPSKLYVD